MKIRKSRVYRNFPLLQYLKTLSDSELKKVIKGGSQELLFTLSELCLNLLRGNVKLTNSQIVKLSPYRKAIVKLAQKKPSLKQRKLILNQNGGMVGALLTLVASLIGPIVSAIR